MECTTKAHCSAAVNHALARTVLEHYSKSRTSLPSFLPTLVLSLLQCAAPHACSVWLLVCAWSASHVAQGGDSNKGGSFAATCARAQVSCSRVCAALRPPAASSFAPPGRQRARERARRAHGGARPTWRDSGAQLRLGAARPAPATAAGGGEPRGRVRLGQIRGRGGSLVGAAQARGGTLQRTLTQLPGKQPLTPVPARAEPTSSWTASSGRRRPRRALRGPCLARRARWCRIRRCRLPRASQPPCQRTWSVRLRRWVPAWARGHWGWPGRRVRYTAVYPLLCRLRHRAAALTQVARAPSASFSGAHPATRRRKQAVTLRTRGGRLCSLTLFSFTR